MVKERDPSSFFYFTPKESEQIGIAYTRFGSERLMEIFQEYLTGKTPSQVNKFHGEDIPQFLKRAMKKDKSVKSVKTSKEPTPHHCPVCGKMWSASSTLSMCPQCGMELSDFENHQEIKEHREWWESTPHNRNQAAG
ncbi:MAG: hypothetical protein B6241_12510 [Spirochaetaceae bacterium 4572_59]|nr:MAG: hypothetical protein B6241_12510 [Spirochaetaceae bacterium 4572_59]